MTRTMDAEAFAKLLDERVRPRKRPMPTPPAPAWPAGARTAPSAGA
ncbi:MAG: hypothetical protein JWO31_67, partial [Phycisphaerales bacterium]|nr:hypothetical protein [Phycisphaerales bacterium]